MLSLWQYIIDIRLLNVQKSVQIYHETERPLSHICYDCVECVRYGAPAEGDRPQARVWHAKWFWTGPVRGWRWVGTDRQKQARFQTTSIPVGIGSTRRYGCLQRV